MGLVTDDVNDSEGVGACVWSPCQALAHGTELTEFPHLVQWLQTAYERKLLEFEKVALWAFDGYPCKLESEYASWFPVEVFTDFDGVQLESAVASVYTVTHLFGNAACLLLRCAGALVI